MLDLQSLERHLKLCKVRCSLTSFVAIGGARRRGEALRRAAGGREGDAGSPNQVPKRLLTCFLLIKSLIYLYLYYIINYINYKYKYEDH